jgi:SAM-dependent MidA family methyltransferase
MNLKNIIIDKIKQSDTKQISFSQYMEMCLYTPNLGYYNNSSIKIGKDGDFTTACEISYLLGHCIANAISISTNLDEKQQKQQQIIFELGAGSGKLCVDIINSKKNKIAKYYILERSAFLRAQQQEYIKQNLNDISNINLVAWIDELTIPLLDKDKDKNINQNKLHITILGNELLDAIPIDLYTYNQLEQKIYSKNISLNNQDELIWCNVESNESSAMSIAQNILENDNPHFEYTIEIHEQTKALLNSLCDMLDKYNMPSQMIWLDYGYQDYEYYHPQRHMGTLMCYHKHKANSNPLINVGEQDITAHVNFSMVQNVLIKNGFLIDYYANQARFLFDHGILEELQNIQSTSNELDYISAAKQAQILLSEAEMGAIFKVLIINKN